MWEWERELLCIEEGLTDILVFNYIFEFGLRELNFCFLMFC